MPNYYPSDTGKLVSSNSQIDNFALRYRHSLQVERDGAEYKFKLSAQTLGQSSGELVEQLRERQTEHFLQFAMQGIKLYCVDATVDWRLIVGLGSEHVQETNMTLHHIYGIPYIPGSAVKGVLRHWWLQEDFDNNEDKALKDKNFLALFGSQEQRGEVQFLDAYPEQVHFAKDIMNPHYPDYYSGSAPPTDSQNPVPINFLTVEKTTFRFAFLAKKQGLLDKLKARLKDVLEMKGIGAKTAVGYGYFRLPTINAQNAPSPPNQQGDQIKGRIENLGGKGDVSQVPGIVEQISKLTDSNTKLECAQQLRKWLQKGKKSLWKDKKHSAKPWRKQLDEILA